MRQKVIQYVLGRMHVLHVLAVLVIQKPGQNRIFLV